MCTEPNHLTYTNYLGNPDEPPEYQEMIIRKCAEGYDDNACQNWHIDQVYAQICTCTEDNCNTDKDCLYTCPLK